MNYLRRRLYEDPSNIELRHYCLIQLILNENWNDLLDILEETPHFHFHLVQFVFKYIPFDERIEKLKQRLKSCKTSFEISSSSSTSIESLEQSILFSSKAKLYQKSLNWIQIGKGECEIIENNQSGEIFLRFWISKNRSINLGLLINLHQSHNFSLSSKNNSPLIIEFQAKNQCDYPMSNSFISYQIRFYSLMDVIRFKEILSEK